MNKVPQSTEDLDNLIIKNNWVVTHGLLKRCLSPAVLRVLCLIMENQKVGTKRKQIVLTLGLSRPVVSRAIKTLIELRLIDELNSVLKPTTNRLI